MGKVLLINESVIGQRIGAFITDHIIITIISMIPFIMNFNKLIEEENSLFLNLSLTMAIGISLYIFKDVLWGRSIGKVIFGIYVKDYQNLERIPSVHRLILRNVLIVIWPIEFIVMLINKENRRLGDKIARTEIIGYSGKIVLRVIIIGVLAFFLFVFSLIIGVAQIIKNDGSYKTSIQYIEKQDEISSITGEIQGYGTFSMGSVSITNGYGVANLSIKVKGKKRNLIVYVYLERSPGSNWIIKDVKY